MFRRWASPLVALGLLVGPAGAQTAPPEPRSWPELLMMHERSSERCRYESCSREDWLQFLQGIQLTELAAPPGGRAYRWLWTDGTVPTYVELTIQNDGAAVLWSNVRRRPKKVGAEDVARFETALARSTFASLPERDSTSRGAVLDYPPDQLMEADVEGRYHFVHRIFAVPEDVRQAGVILERLAGIR